MSGPPILIRCEGSQCPTVSGICQMCGQPHESPTPEHERRDILAMIERGDFG